VLSGASIGFIGEKKGVVFGVKKPFQDNLDIKKPALSKQEVRSVAE
jgi:hypothetical protein